MKLKHVILAAILSCCGYICCFLFVVHKPLSIGVQRGYYDSKLTYLTSVKSQKKLVLLAGSNGRFSHRCETLEQALHIPCVNMSISADVSMDFQFEKIKPHLNAGDLVYLPLEFSALRGPITSGSEIPYVLAYDHSHLGKMNPEQLANTVFYCDLKYLIRGVGEMALEKAGIKPRMDASTLNKNGDESGHTLEKGKDYRKLLDEFKFVPQDANSIDLTSANAGLVSDFLKWSEANQVTVIGGLPTIFDDVEIADDLVSELRAFYVDHGHQFLTIECKSQYPRQFFFDTPMHLAEKYQILHSESLAKKLEMLVQE